MVTDDDEDELVGVDEELEDEPDELVGLEEDELEELVGFDEDELDDELLDCSEEELADEDELSELLDFSEVLDELTEMLVVSVGVEVFAPSLHAVKVKTIAAATIALKIFLVFIFSPFHKL